MNSDLACEKQAAINTIENLEQMDLKGILVRLDGVVSAFGISAPLTQDMATLQYEKAFSNVKGLYQYLDRECARRLFEGFTYIIDRKLLPKVQPVKVDADSICFRLSGNGLYPPTGCGACPYMCGANGGKRCSGVCATCEDHCPTGQRKMRKKRM